MAHTMSGASPSAPGTSMMMAKPMTPSSRSAPSKRSIGRTPTRGATRLFARLAVANAVAPKARVAPYAAGGSPRICSTTKGEAEIQDLIAANAAATHSTDPTKDRSLPSRLRSAAILSNPPECLSVGRSASGR